MNDDRHLWHVIINRTKRKPPTTAEERQRNLAEYLESL